MAALSEAFQEGAAVRDDLAAAGLAAADLASSDLASSDLAAADLAAADLAAAHLAVGGGGGARPVCASQSDALQGYGQEAAKQLQLQQLMELGFHAQLAVPFCDGVSPIDEIIERISAAEIAGAAVSDDEADDEVRPRAGGATPRTPALWAAAKRMMRGSSRSA